MREIVERELQQETEETSAIRHFPLGTRLVRGPYPLRYALAGESIGADYPAYAHYNPPHGEEMPSGEYQAFVLWGDMRPKGETGLVMGWPVVDVAAGQYFWLREKGLP